MRDVGILIWVVFLIVGVVGSMVSSARRQLAAGKEPKPGQAPPQWKPPPGTSQPPTVLRLTVPRGQGDPLDASAAREQIVQALLQARAQAASPSLGPHPRPAPPPKPAPPPSAPPRLAPPPPRSEPPAAPEVHRPRRRSLFGTGPDLVRAVIAAEVLGKPRGLNDEYR